MSNFYDKVYTIVHQIPQGKVSSYGRIAHMLGAPQAARAVGYALNALKDAPRELSDSVPWQRVVNHHGRITIINRDASANHQAELLRQEGVVVSDSLQIDLDQYLWAGLHWAEVEALLAPPPEGV